MAQSTAQGSLIRRSSSMMLRSVIENETRGHLYCRTAWCSGSTGLANVLIGGFVISTIIYTLQDGDLHVALYTIAYHFFTAEAILTLSYINGWSTPMRWKHRKIAHVLLQLCGMICAGFGTAVVAINRGLSTTAHGLTGIITLVLTVLSALIGPFVFKGKKNAILFHMSFGVPCFSAASICVVFGLVKPEFKQWATPPILHVLLAFVIFYSLFIAIATFMKCMKKM